MKLPSASGSSWRLASDVAKQVQGLVTSGFGDLPAACALVLSAGTEGGAWLDALNEAVPVTASNGKSTPSVALAFTSLGLRQLGVSDEIVNGFSLPFVEGMMQEDRRRRLGDVDKEGNPLASVQWGLRPKPAPEGTLPQPRTPEPSADDPERPVHALLLLYHRTHDDLVALVDKTVEPALSAGGVKVVRRLALDLSVGDTEDVREHFGFVDGISQPIPYGDGTDDGTGKTVALDPLHGVPLGELLLGHPDAHGTPSQGPFMVGTAAAGGGFVPSRDPPAEAAVAAMENPGGQQLRDLGLNGTYLVVRELRQDVDAFWASMKEAAASLNQGDPAKPPVDADWVAARVVGRTRDGHMLRPDGPLPLGPNGFPDNDFLYFVKDRYGLGCPMGSHIRRANPRDGLSYKAGACEDLLRSANAHRILRRGRKYGGGIGGTDPESEKGLLFICLNGDIARQFEFVQQNWMLNPNFTTLYNEVDPLVGPEGEMTLPAKPLRRRVHVKTFVTLVGGDYFFLPSLPTLRILAALRASEKDQAV